MSPKYHQIACIPPSFGKDETLHQFTSLGFDASLPGATHKQMYDKFCRQCCDRKKFPVSLAQHCIRDKLDLFRTWLEMHGDWNKNLGFAKGTLLFVYV